MARQKFRVTLPTGENVWLTGNNISEAFASGLQKYAQSSANTTQQEDAAITLKTFVDTIYRSTFIDNLAPTTRASYNQHLRLNILPFMGEMPMNEINVATMQAFYDWMATAAQRGRKQNLNRKTIERVSGLVEKIFRVAMDLKIVNDTPIKKTLLRNNDGRASHHTALSYSDMDKVKRDIPALEDERQRVYMALLAYAGMRPEEILGLGWQSVFLEEGFCEMVRTVTYPNKSECVVRDCGKTELSVRTVALPDPVISILQQAKRGTGFVLHGNSKDKPLCYSTYQRTYQAAFKALGIAGKCCNYDFRTTYGTELCEAGLTTKQVADMMGHSTTRMVETVYARTRHASVMRQRERLNLLNQAYDVTKNVTQKEPSSPYKSTGSADGM